MLSSLSGTGLPETVARTALSNATTQAVAVGTGLQEKFSWTQVAASAVGAAVGAQVGKWVGDGLGNGISQGAKNFAARFAGSMASSGAQSLVMGQRPNWGAIAADSFGSTLGNAIGEQIAGKDRTKTVVVGGENSDGKRASDRAVDEIAKPRAPAGQIVDLPGEEGVQLGAGGSGAGNTSSDGENGRVEAGGRRNPAVAQADAAAPVAAGAAAGSSPIEEVVVTAKRSDYEYINEYQRAALIDLLKQDPTMTPEKLARAQDMAKLSNAVYLKDTSDPSKGFRGTVPEYYERVTKFGEGKLKGFSQDNFENRGTGFYAGLFHDTRDDSYTLVYRGTDDGPDWTKGNIQALSPSAPQYEQGIELATKLQDVLGNQLTDITGHSLGGGLSSAASMLTGIRATTFNGAGLNAETVTSRGGTMNTARAESLITNYRVEDELLTNLQERGSIGSMPLALLTPVIGPSAIALNTFAAAMPNAAGQKITIHAFDQNNQSMSWAARNNLFRMQPVALHGMDYVMRGMLINDTKRP